MRFCIATWELKPFTRGGIGVLVHNLLKVYGGSPGADISILWYGGRTVTERLFTRVFPNCRFFSAEEWALREQDGEGTLLLPPDEAFVLDRHLQSFRLMRALRAIEKEHGGFEVIEFPDFGGAAFATLQEKRLGRAFARSRIAVRIHSTESVLRRHDHRPMESHNLLVADIERKALCDADIVVGHLQPVVNDVAVHFNFGDDWRRKAILEQPPVLVDSDPADGAWEFNEHTPLVFTSKVQWFKRPHVFINAAVGFIDAEPDFKGEALLLAHIINDELRHHCEALIPEHLKQRIRIAEDLSGDFRDKLIAGSIAAFPSAYESFCLAAYEANRLGALVILNRENPAFGSDTPWQQGVNCETFDGTAQGLVDVLRDMWRRRHSIAQKPVPLARPVTPYWMRPARDGTGERCAALSRPQLSLVIMVSDEFGDPMESIPSALLADELDLDIILACDLPPAAPARAAALARLKGSCLVSDGTVRTVDLGFRGGTAALCNLGLREAHCDIIAFARAGSSFDPAFLADAVRALHAHPEYDIVIPQMAYENSSTNRQSLQADKVRIGEGLNIAVVDNFLGAVEMVARRAAVVSIGFDETLDRYVDWDFHYRACVAGHRYIVSNRIEARLETITDAPPKYYRAHLDSVLVKHSASYRGGRVGLVAAFDAQKSDNNAETNPHSLLFAKRPLDYYLWETRQWWRIAFKHPTKPLRWLLLREMQLHRSRIGPSRHG